MLIQQKLLTIRYQVSSHLCQVIEAQAPTLYT